MYFFVYLMEIDRIVSLKVIKKNGTFLISNTFLDSNAFFHSFTQNHKEKWDFSC